VNWDWPDSTVTRVIDGDSLVAEVHRDLGFNGTATFRQKLRLNRINAKPAKTPEGKAATAAVIGMVTDPDPHHDGRAVQVRRRVDGSPTSCVRSSPDRYLTGTPLGDVLSGLAHILDPEQKPDPQLPRTGRRHGRTKIRRRSPEQPQKARPGDRVRARRVPPSADPSHRQKGPPHDRTREAQDRRASPRRSSRPCKPLAAGSCCLILDKLAGAAIDDTLWPPLFGSSSRVSRSARTRRRRADGHRPHPRVACPVAGGPGSDRARRRVLVS
jgi:hypothetical protein